MWDKVGETLLMMFPTMQPGVDFSYNDSTGEILVWNADILGPQPANMQALDATLVPRYIETSKNRKRKELENKFQAAWDEQYGTQIAVGLVLYFEFPNDPRTVVVKAARTNFINKTNALNDLGRSGRPPLTEANIAAIVW